MPKLVLLKSSFCELLKISEMEKIGKWLGKKKPEHSSRVTRSAAAPSTTRASYNEDIVGDVGRVTREGHGISV